MKRFAPLLAAVLALLCLSAPAHAGWVEGTATGVRTDSATPGSLIYFNSYFPANGILNTPEATWTTYDVTTLGVPADAKAVFLSGILIITHGQIQEPCDLTVTLRATGNALPMANYIGQTVELLPGNGQRSNMAVWVPVIGGKLDFAWQRNTVGTWPDHCAYGTSLQLQAYVR